MPIEKVLVVEDEEVICLNLESQLRQRRCEVVTTPSLGRAREAVAKDNFDLVFLDVRLPDGNGTDLLKELQLRAQRPLVVIMTGFASVESAVDCMRNGAFEYLIKPFSENQIDMVLTKAAEFTRMLRVNQFLSQDSGEPEGEMLGRSPAMEQVRQLIRQVARTSATVLIQGESGTGKELIARGLHRESPRASAPLIKVNCAAIPNDLMESEFFGHEKGAFTGALNKREGRFELAHGGTILLDEISEISPSLQAKLLRVLQEREFERVGGSRTIKVDVRVIATTNRRLEQSVERKEFREDLFFRLNVVPIHVPPLRERPEDITFLAQHFLSWAARKHGGGAQGFSDECIAVLNAHRWPGNVRELQNVVERAIILAGNAPLIEAEHLCLTSGPAVPLSPAIAQAPAGPRLSPTGPETDFPSLDELEKRHILAALERCRNNRTQAAKLLGISVRTLRNKLHDYHALGASPVPQRTNHDAPGVSKGVDPTAN